MKYKVNYFDGRWHVTWTSEQGHAFTAYSNYSREDAIFRFANLFQNDVRYQILKSFFIDVYYNQSSHILKIQKEALKYPNSNQIDVLTLLSLHDWQILEYGDSDWEYALKVHVSLFVDDEQDPNDPFKRGTITII